MAVEVNAFSVKINHAHNENESLDIECDPNIEFHQFKQMIIQRLRLRENNNDLLIGFYNNNNIELINQHNFFTMRSNMALQPTSQIMTLITGFMPTTPIISAIHVTQNGRLNISLKSMARNLNNTTEFNIDCKNTDDLAHVNQNDWKKGDFDLERNNINPFGEYRVQCKSVNVFGESKWSEWTQWKQHKEVCPLNKTQNCLLYQQRTNLHKTCIFSLFRRIMRSEDYYMTLLTSCNKGLIESTNTPKMHHQTEINYNRSNGWMGKIWRYVVHFDDMSHNHE